MPLSGQPTNEMQLFIVSKDPTICARYLDDRRVNKIILESGQMLSTCLRMHGCSDYLLYKSTRPRHPVVEWVCRSRENFQWTLSYWVALNREKKSRYGTWHSAWFRFQQGEVFRKHSCIVPSTKLYVPANCTRRKELGIDFTWVKPVEKAYRMYLDARWDIEAESEKYFPKATLNRDLYAS